MNNYGGQRTHSGRPIEVEVETKRVNITIDDDTARILKALGRGNLSRGIREVARRLTAGRLTG